MHDDPELRTGVVTAFTAYVVWGLLTLYWKQLDDFEAFELVGWRVTSAAVIMAVATTATGGWGRLRSVARDPRLLGRVACAAVLLTGNWCAYVWAVVHGNVIETSLGYFMAPLGTMAFGVVAFGEHLDRAQRIAIGFAVLAVAVLVVSYGEVPWIALVLASSWSVYGVLKKRVPLSATESMSAETLVVLLPAIAVVVATSGRAGSVPSTASAADAVLVALTGVATVVPLMLFARAAHRVPLTILGPMQYLIPTINFLLGWLVFDEALPPSRVAGFALVWCGLVVMTAGTLRRRSKRARTRQRAVVV
ncbi:MAG: EamA family transporter RarD [Ilumatobacteraceae bacterium]